jgi:hypothetical protein
MNAKTLCAGGLVVFALLSIMDLGYTWLVIREYPDRVIESNPIAHEWLHRFGWQGFVVFKMAGIFVVAGSVLLIARRHPSKAAGVVLFACLAVGLVVLYSRHLLVNPPRRIIEQDETQDESSHSLPSEFGQSQFPGLGREFSRIA